MNGVNRIEYRQHHADQPTHDRLHDSVHASRMYCRACPGMADSTLAPASGARPTINQFVDCK
jgi:hypothetical protein